MSPRSLAVSLALCLLGAPGFCFEWPVEKVAITSTFAESRQDHFHSGVDLGGGEQPVLPIAAGELVFAHEELWSTSGLPVGLGNYVVLQHPGGVRSIYAHLKEGSVDGQRRLYDRGAALGVVGSSGYSTGTHLHLSIIDSEMGTVINPLLLLPALSDRQPPALGQVLLSDGRQQLPLSARAALRPGTYEVFAEVFDLREEVSFLWKLAPYKISLYQGGRELASLVFDSLQARESAPGSSAAGELVLAGSQRSFGQLYAGPWLYRLGAVSLPPGEASIAVFAVDFAGNESSKEFVLEVAGPR